MGRIYHMEFISNATAQAIGHFIFELEKIGNICWRYMLFLQKGRILLILFFKRVKKVIKSSDDLLNQVIIYQDVINYKSFFSAANMTGFLVNLWLRKFLIQFSINLIENMCSLLISLLNDMLLNEILKNPKQLKTFEIIKWKSNHLYILRK